MMAPPGVAGTLVSGAYATSLLGEGGVSREHLGTDALPRWWRTVRAKCGPASSTRTLVDVAAAPLASLLGYTLRRPQAVSGATWVAVLEAEGTYVPIVLTAWGTSLDSAWRTSVRHSLSIHARWCFLFNGTHLRVLDAGRTFARRHLDFELDAVAESEATARLLIMLASAASLRPTAGESSGSPLAAAVAASDAHGVRVCAALRVGVHHAIEHLLIALLNRRRGRRARNTPPMDVLYEQALTAVYRILFLCFAEARGLVPAWHPVYRDAYTIESLRTAAERAAAPHGLWEAFQAISRLAHQGCEAGDLRVTAFNGRLFAPARAPLLEHAALPDGHVRDVVLALSTTEGGC